MHSFLPCVAPALDAQGCRPLCPPFCTPLSQFPAHLKGVVKVLLWLPVHDEDHVQRMQAAPNSPGLICSFQQWYPLWLSWYCLTNSNRLLTLERTSDNTHTCRSPTPTVNGCDLTLPTRTQTSDETTMDLTASKGQTSKPQCRNTSQSFFQGTGLNFFLQVTIVDIFAKLLWLLLICLTLKIWSAVVCPGRKLHWVTYSFGSIIAQQIL